jgi:hypothetical protein
VIGGHTTLAIPDAMSMLPDAASMLPSAASMLPSAASLGCSSLPTAN